MRHAHLHEIPAIIYGIAPRHAAELWRICETLEIAVAQADGMMSEGGSHRGFREIVNHAREMHGSLLKALRAVEPNVPREVRVIADEVNRKIAELEDVLTMLRASKH